MINLIDLKLERLDDVMHCDGEGIEAHQRLDIALGTDREIVETNDLMPGLEKKPAEMGSEKASSTGNKNSFPFTIVAQRNFSAIGSSLRITRAESA